MKKVLALLLVVILVSAAFSGCSNDQPPINENIGNSGGVGYEDTLNIFSRFVCGLTLSQSQFRQLQPQDYLDYMEEQDILTDYDRSCQEQLKVNKETAEATFGTNCVATYKVVEDTKMDEAEYPNATEHLLQNSWYNPDDLQEIRVLAVDITFEGDDSTQTMRVDYEIMKYQGSWYILSFDSPEIEELFY